MVSMRDCVLKLLLLAAASEGVIGLRNANFEIYPQPQVHIRKPYNDAIVSLTTAAGAVAAGSTLGFYAYRRFGDVLKQVAARDSNRTATFDVLVSRQTLQQDELSDIRAQLNVSKTNSNTVLEKIKADNRIMKEKINAIIRQLQIIDKSINERNDDTLETIKYFGETMSKNLRADISDDVNRLDTVIRDLRNEMNSIVSEQHKVYIEKLKNFTEIVSQNVFDAIAESESSD